MWLRVWAPGGRALAVLRTAQGMTQADLAEVSGVARQTINAIEADRRTPQIATAVALAQALGCTTSAIVDAVAQRDTPPPGSPSGGVR